jgi:6-phosphogluconolactonase
METPVNQRSGVEVSVFQDIEELSRAAAQSFQSLTDAAISAHGFFVVALSGGSTPRRLYALLSSSPYQTTIDWRRIHLFWADERCVPPDHPESNYALLRDSLLVHVPLPRSNVHRIEGEKEPGEAARKYEQSIREFFGTHVPAFDLVMLGVGEDGHTASLFPGSTTLHEVSRTAVPVYRETNKMNRVTLTLPVINHASHVLFLAAGKAKAGVIKNILYEENSKGYPAGLVWPTSGTLAWFLDREAAGKTLDI